MSKLEDLLGKKKEIVPVLDLSKTIVNSKEEYKRLSEKVPDYKMRPIKVSALSVCLLEQINSEKILNLSRTNPSIKLSTFVHLYRFDRRI